MTKPVHIIGGGLAGTEAAWQLARAGVPAIIHEMRPHKTSPAHQTEGLAELVCSNSFRSDDSEHNAVGLLHWEMRAANSLMMQAAEEAKVPAGDALAVDRDVFSAAITKALEDEPLVEIRREEVSGLPPEDWGQTIIATGPLTSTPLAEAIQAETGADALAFFDAIAPIVYLDSINMDIAWRQSRYDKKGPGGDGADYINCPMDKDQYDAFIHALVTGDKTEFQDWEKDTPYFEGCLPIEVMAERGPETLRFGPMKPVGLTNPATGKRAHAVVQLRQDNLQGTIYNIVGFQTKLRHGAQANVFRMIPGLENAEFARLGGIHRNTFIESPKLLDGELRLKSSSRIRFAGQIAGVEGYVESAGLGMLAGRFAAAEALGQTLPAPADTTALGCMLAHVTGGHMSGEGASKLAYQPMNVNFGLLPPLTEAAPRGRKGRIERRRLMTERAKAEIQTWLAGGTVAAAE
jgi:methylenetetrahydrofolate--tRNA-(uracil-5-)-methyltransferase